MQPRSYAWNSLPTFYQPYTVRQSSTAWAKDKYVFNSLIPARLPRDIIEWLSRIWNVAILRIVGFLTAASAIGNEWDFVDKFFKSVSCFNIVLYFIKAKQTVISPTLNKNKMKTYLNFI